VWHVSAIRRIHTAKWHEIVMLAFPISMNIYQRVGHASLGALLLLGLLSPCVAANSSLSGGMRNPALDWESLPSIRTGVRVWSHTSKNPLNFTVMDWTNYTLQDANGYEEAFYKGKSGMLIQDWFDPNSDLGNLKLFLKDEAKPDYDMPFINYFNGKTYPFWLWYHQDNMLWAFPCLPFDSLFKASIQKRPQWYQFTLALYREDRFSEALTPEESETLEKKIDEPVGTFPGANPGNKTESSSPEIAPQQTAVVFDNSFAGVIRSIKIDPPSADSAILDNLTIRITTDGEVTAELPVSMFFGGYPGADIRKAKGMPAGFDGKSLYCYFPMPFWKSMKIELISKQANPVKLVCAIGWSSTNTYPQSSTGVFKVQYNNNVAVKAGEPSFANLEVKGSGTMVGCVSRLTGNIEGNFTTYTDDSETPVIETTGGEDYFNHSYGIHGGFDSAFSGGLQQTTTGYRFQIVDYIPFLSSFKFTQDHAQYFAHDRDANFLSAVFYYHNPRKFIVLTDSVDVGKPESERAHDYRIMGTSGKTRLQSDTGTYENDYAVPLTDEGRWTDKETSFKVAIAPDNDGVRLRKRINQTAYHQELEVFVDNVSAGTWFEQGSNYVENYDNQGYHDVLTKKYAADGTEVPTWQNGKMPAKFRDTIFDIPAALTHGKRVLNLRFVTKNSLAVVPADAGLTNEYYYWIYSYAPAR
jgi:hypothetical protein